MVPAASPIPGAQRAGVEMVAVTGVVAAGGDSPAHCGLTITSNCATRALPPATLQSAVPEHVPLQPVNAEPAAACACSTIVLVGCAVHVPGQSMPAGVEMTLPEPVPVSCTVTRNDGGGAAKLAVTAWSASIVSVHGPVPAQSPCHPLNEPPGSGPAVRTTAVPAGRSCLQSVRHTRLGATLWTDPGPVTCTLTDFEAAGGPGSDPPDPVPAGQAAGAAPASRPPLAPLPPTPPPPP